VGKKKSGIRAITRDAMVQRGEMTPADAESEAKRQGLGKLASEPDPNDYDPMREPFWTLPMTVAWIAYRAPKTLSGIGGTSIGRNALFGASGSGVSGRTAPSIRGRGQWFDASKSAGHVKPPNSRAYGDEEKNFVRPTFAAVRISALDWKCRFECAQT
jgi:hypothetical protein